MFDHCFRFQQIFASESKILETWNCFPPLESVIQVLYHVSRMLLHINHLLNIYILYLC